MKFTIAITLTKCLYVTTEFKNGDLELLVHCKVSKLPTPWKFKIPKKYLQNVIIVISWIQTINIRFHHRKGYN